MITKDQLAASMLHECDVVRHLYDKLQPGAFDYRPTPGQRSTIELLRYIAICGSAGISCLAHADWKRFRAYGDGVKEMTPEQFPAALQRQRDEIEAFFTGITEHALETQPAPLPGGTMTQPLGLAILNAPFKWLAAYKLQLFLYAKATGAHDIGTSNAWRGADAPPRVA